MNQSHLLISVALSLVCRAHTYAKYIHLLEPIRSRKSDAWEGIGGALINFQQSVEKRLSEMEKNTESIKNQSEEDKNDILTELRSLLKDKKVTPR